MNDIERPRRPSAGGYARGDETRLRIIEAAIELFGERGFDSASTRDIAARAGVKAPALWYYFENKESVYRACAEQLAEDAWTNLAPIAGHAAEVLRDNGDTPALIDAFIRIQEAIADRMFIKGYASSNQRLFFAREHAGHEPSIASEILARRLRQPLNEAGAKLISRITGLAVDDPVTLIRLLSLQGQLLVFHVSSRSALTLLGWNEIDAVKSELLKSTVREQTRLLLQMWSEERDAAPSKQAKPQNCPYVSHT
ncbi:TetR family transcriptional regulator [Caballeronia udeis]|uniref:TetR family transcriptional regulator n=1 Tax=Caballeronia udeis TaxID=1232866 RepID=A0A158K0J0_9BURK|nr:CerR family C-terminal domain-containing protein [Caballeronia udeis]SAL74223.1 TetR family transcriptional regulator [Caballeronia udeis]